MRHNRDDNQTIDPQAIEAELDLSRHWPELLLSTLGINNAKMKNLPNQTLAESELNFWSPT